MALGICSKPGCNYPVRARRLCAKHYRSYLKRTPKEIRSRKSSTPAPPVRVETAPLLAVLEHYRDSFQAQNPDVWGLFGGPLLMPLTYQRFRRIRRLHTIDIYEADRIACGMGIHPSAIWPDFDRVDAA